MLQSITIGLTHVRFGKTPNRGRQRRGEEQRLAVAGTLAEDSLDLWTESDVQHPIGLVEHDAPNPIGPQRSPLQMIVQAAGSTDHDLNTILKLTKLPSDVLATGQHGDFRFHTIGQTFGFASHLVGQFAGRHDHQGLRIAALVQRIELFKNWNRKSGRFSRARAGLADHVETVQGQWNQLRLDRRRLGEARVLERPPHHRRKF